MYGITIKYKGPGCYRFLDTLENTIYVGSAKNVHTRLSQHFSKKGSNAGKEAYSKTARVEIIKTDDYASALALEQYLSINLNTIKEIRTIILILKLLLMKSIMQN